MTTRVCVFGSRIDDASRSIVEREIERGRNYYNGMIAAVNDDIAGPPNPEKRGERLPGKAARIELLAAWFCTSPEKAKSIAARAIYRRIARVSRNVRASPAFSAAKSGCYTGTYHAVQAAFDQAVSSKRVGVWPGEPFRFRRRNDNSGTTIGVHIQPSTTWGAIRSGRHEICNSDPLLDDGRYLAFNLKVSKDSPPIAVSVALGKKCRGKRRTIPDEALVSHVVLCRRGDYGTRGKYELHVTAKTDFVAATGVSLQPATCAGSVGIDIGWKLRDDGSILVAVTSGGTECVVPPYAVRMALRNTELQAERDELANEARARHLDCPSKSSIGTARWIEQRFDQSEAEYLAKESALRCTQDHVRRRYQNIRQDIYKKFSRQHRCVFILKTKLKETAEAREKWTRRAGDEFERTVASCFELAQLLRNAGAVETKWERSADHTPTQANAISVLDAGASGDRQERKAPRQVSKFRKRPQSGQDHETPALQTSEAGRGQECCGSAQGTAAS
jgi:hypothetical protein